MSSFLALVDPPDKLNFVYIDIEISGINGNVKGVAYCHWLKHIGPRSWPIKIPCLHLRLREVTQGLAQNPTSRSQDSNPDLLHSSQSIPLSALQSGVVANNLVSGGLST